MRDHGKPLFLIAACLLSVIISGHMFGQTPPTDFERFLVPIAPGRVLGAYGSEWVTELTVSNLSQTPVYVSRNPHMISGAFVPLPPFATELVTAFNVQSQSVVGAIGIVQRGRAEDVAFTLRTSDVSRQHESWGTTIPVVREDELFSRRFSLSNIPADPRFRLMLRIYDINPATTPAVRVRIYGFNRAQPFVTASDELIHEFTPAFVMPDREPFPASASLPLQFSVPSPDLQRLRVEVEPLDGAKDYWAFVSVTHLETQHVTAIVPE